MNYTQIDKTHIDFFIAHLGEENVLLGENCNLYGSDHTENLSYPPDTVLFPINTDEVVLIMKYCNVNNISVTPSAALTGLSGGAIPVFGGVSLSLTKMNKIISINKKNFQATVEPGVINEEFQNILKEYKLFYPPDPASKGSCTLGGNFALNAGGPKAVKYGVTSHYVLNLEIVLPNGDVFWTGANTLKNSTGYNLTQLIVGSEGTLAIITKAVLKLLPLPTETILMLVPFRNDFHACDAVADIMNHQIIPSGLEFMEAQAVNVVRDQNYHNIPFAINNKTSSYLLIELDGERKEKLLVDAEKIYSLLSQYNCGDILLAETKEEQERIWKVRRSIGLAVKSYSIYKEEDTVVPRANLTKLLKGVKAIGVQYNFKSICYGHAGDGNLHVNILKTGLSDHEWDIVLKEAIRKIFELCISLNGTISGEHGIGLVQKEYMDIPFSSQNLNLQKNIKLLFDPKNILNPGKIFK
ncbi:MAG: FAD-binding oxidoreductase [Flavobacteriales bacterium]|nr:FAD-binding oxidoreductase [Flavobacteriales bacterium]|tara:strand:- start:2920 stop:4323 length:1404 start_codon:yes stop_codon:yes gene_type:complete